MTAANHMLAGAVVAVSIQRPLLIVPLAIASHFLLDALPHFGVHREDAAKRNKHLLFRYVLAIDILLTAALLILLPSLLQDAVSWWVLLVGMVVAYVPDLAWVHHFFYELWRRQKLQRGRISKFHAWIQWSERPWGWALELVWFGAMGVLLAAVAT